MSTDIRVRKRGPFEPSGLGLELPAKFTTIRPHQRKAVDDILAAFAAGNEVVFLDAPVGSGKTLIAEMVRQSLATNALYVCSDIALQRQFMADFTYASLLMGRSNYPTEHHGDARDRWGKLEVSAEDCTSTTPDGEDCWHCETHATCPYWIAREEATGNPLAVLNTAYLMAETNSGATRFGKLQRGLIIIDEADTLEDQLLNHVQFEVPAWIERRLGLQMPAKAVRKPTLAKWLRDTAEVARKGRTDKLFPEMKELRRIGGFIEECKKIADELDKDVGDDDESGTWLRDYDTKTLLLRPVLVGPYGTSRLWRHASKFLLMSGTIISSDEMAESLGLPWDYATVTVPMTFPVENRPITVAPVARMTAKSSDEDYANLVYAVEQIAKKHEGERILVHTVSKFLAELLVARCELGSRNVCSYTYAGGKKAALDDYMRVPGSIMFAQSMDRGVDLPGEACRVQVVAKVPFGSLGDRRVSARLHLPGGKTWYDVNAVRKIVQMSGRGVRNDKDQAHTYIVDAQFATNLYSTRGKGLFPQYWRDAVDERADVRWLMRKYAGTKHAQV